MDAEKMNAIISALIGIKQSEWCIISDAVNQIYRSESGKLQLADSERLERLISLNLTD